MSLLPLDDAPPPASSTPPPSTSSGGGSSSSGTWDKVADIAKVIPAVGPLISSVLGGVKRLLFGAPITSWQDQQNIIVPFASQIQSALASKYSSALADLGAEMYQLALGSIARSPIQPQDVKNFYIQSMQRDYPGVPPADRPSWVLISYLHFTFHAMPNSSEDTVSKRVEPAISQVLAPAAVKVLGAAAPQVLGLPGPVQPAAASIGGGFQKAIDFLKANPVAAVLVVLAFVLVVVVPLVRGRK